MKEALKTSEWADDFEIIFMKNKKKKILEGEREFYLNLKKLFVVERKPSENLVHKVYFILKSI